MYNGEVGLVEQSDLGVVGEQPSKGNFVPRVWRVLAANQWVPAASLVGAHSVLIGSSWLSFVGIPLSVRPRPRPPF